MIETIELPAGQQTGEILPTHVFLPKPEEKVRDTRFWQWENLDTEYQPEYERIANEIVYECNSIAEQEITKLEKRLEFANKEQNLQEAMTVTYEKRQKEEKERLEEEKQKRLKLEREREAEFERKNQELFKWRTVEFS